MPATHDARALLAARITGLLILAFTAVELLDRLVFTWLRAVFDGDLELGSKYAGDVLEVLAPTYSATWVLGFLGWGIGLLLLARARGPARAAAIVATILAGVGVLSTAGYVTLATAPLEEGLVERLEVWADLASACNVLVPLAATVTLMLFARGHARARALLVLAGVSVLSPMLTALAIAELELIRPLYESSIPWAALLNLASHAALGVAFVWASAGLDARSLDHASARGLELAHMLVWARVGLIAASVFASSKAMRELQRSQVSSTFGTQAPEGNHELLVDLAAWLGHLEAAVGVALALSLASIGLQHRARERLSGAVGGSLLFVLALVGAGLSLLQHEALRQHGSYFDNPLLDHLQLVQAIDPYMRGLSVLAMLLCVSTLIRVADPGWVRDDLRLRAIRFSSIVVLASLVWIFGREGIATLGKGVLLVGVFALAAAIMALIDLTALLRATAQALRGTNE